MLGGVQGGLASELVLSEAEGLESLAGVPSKLKPSDTGGWERYVENRKKFDPHGSCMEMAYTVHSLTPATAVASMAHEPVVPKGPF